MDGHNRLHNSTMDCGAHEYGSSSSGIDCNSMLTLSGTVSANLDVESSDWIESTQLLDATAVVDYDAAISIELKPNFEAELGAQLQAFIDGCNNGSGGLLNAMATRLK